MCKESSKYAHPWSSVHITIAQTPEPRPSTQGAPPRTIISAGRQVGVGGEMAGLDLGASGETHASTLQAAMRSAGVLVVFIPLPRVYVRHIWLPDRRGGHRQRLHSRASGRPGPAPAPPRGRASAGAARRLCADLHVVFTRYCSALLMTRLTATQRRYTRSPRRSAAPRGLCFNEACASIGPHARHFARAADSASACFSGATAAQVVSPSNPQPRSSIALGAGFGHHGGGSRAHEPGPSRAMKTLREGSAQNRSRVART